MELEIVTLLTTLNFWLISVASGIVLALVRKVVEGIKPSWEVHKLYKTLVPLLPFVIAPLLALIPGLRVTEVVAQSIILGLIAGAFSGASYPFLKRAFNLILKSEGSK